MERTKATEVRKNWSAVCDSVVRKRPEFIRRVRDDLVLMSKDDLLSMLEHYHYLARAYKENDGSVTVSLDDIDIAENGETIESARRKAAYSILEYAEEYYENYALYSNAPNRKPHIPFVLRALLINDVDLIEETIICQNGEN